MSSGQWKGFHEGPNASRGGRIGSIEQDKLRPEFAQALKGAKTGAVVGPVETPEGFYFLRVADMQEAKKQPFREVSEQIQKDLRKKAIDKVRAQYRESLLREAIVRYFF